MRSIVFATIVAAPPSMVAQCSGSSSSESGGSETETIDTDTGSSTSSDSESASSTAPACATYDSSSADSAPIQVAGSGLPWGASTSTWSIPATYTSWVAFDGSDGSPAVHEGNDYIHDDASEAEVDVAAAAAGEVVYVRTGCPESSLFSSNTSVRECGSGWGNHVVVHHGGLTFTRYAHLSHGQVFVEVGDQLSRGDVLGVMGNTGRSETRHLHFELGYTTDTIDPCGGSWSFDRVYDPSLLGI